MIAQPVLFINFKTYAESTGDAAVKLARAAKAAAAQSGKSVVLVVQPTDIRAVAKASGLPVFAQHTDPVGYGSHSGHILPESVRDAGAVGTVLNHAERPLSQEVLAASLARAREAGLQVLACANDVSRAVEIAGMTQKPDFLAIEPPELIGNPQISVATANPKIISDAVAAVHAVAPLPVIVGAGIKDAQDLAVSVKLGAAGVFVSSAIQRAKQKKRAILSMLEGF